MNKYFSLIVLVILLAGNSFAQAGSRVVQDRTNGFSFTLPKNWTFKEADGGYLLQESGGSAVIAMKPHAYDRFESFAAAEVNLQKEGLKVAGELQDLGNGGRTFRLFRTEGGKNVIVDTFYLQSPFSGGLVLVSITAGNENANNAFETANLIGKSVKFSTPQRSPLDQQLKTAFSGKKLSFYYTGNGYSEQKMIWLCGSGIYESKTETSSVSGLGSGSTSGGDKGSWLILTTGNTSSLILNSQQGKGQRKFAITQRQASNEVGLNGAKYFVQTHTGCN